MTTSALLLLAAVALGVIVCATYLLRHRKPTSLEEGIDAFTREMRALAPERSPAVGVDPSPAVGTDPSPVGPGSASASAPPAEPGTAPAGGGERRG